jgi:hypothetical protein
MIGTIFSFSLPVHPVNAGEEKHIKVSCTQNGRIVYQKNEVSETETYDQRKLIADKFPKAMCIFLEKSSSRLTSTPEEANAIEYDDELLTALAAITNGKTGERYPENIARLFSDEENTKSIISGSDGRFTNNNANEKGESGFVNLTLGVYKNLPMVDVLGHWKIMQKDGSILKKMTPTFDNVDNITVMSILKVPDELADQVCKEASKRGQGCIAFF